MDVNLGLVNTQLAQKASRSRFQFPWLEHTVFGIVGRRDCLERRISTGKLRLLVQVFEVRFTRPSHGAAIGAVDSSDDVQQ